MSYINYVKNVFLKISTCKYNRTRVYENVNYQYIVKNIF